MQSEYVLFPFSNGEYKEGRNSRKEGRKPLPLPLPVVAGTKSTAERSNCKRKVSRRQVFDMSNVSCCGGVLNKAKIAGMGNWPTLQ